MLHVSVACGEYKILFGSFGVDIDIPRDVTEVVMCGVTEVATCCVTEDAP